MHLLVQIINSKGYFPNSPPVYNARRSTFTPWCGASNDMDNCTACSDYLGGDIEKCGVENIVPWSGIPRGGVSINQFLGPCVALWVYKAGQRGA